MDEQEMIRFLRSELYQAMERDPELRAALKHIEAGKGTFQDTAQYSERTSELLGQILSKHVDELPEGMREAVCKALLRERYEEMNGICAEVQEQLDAQIDIRLQPQRAPYPAERVQQVAHALEDPTVALSVIQRRAKAPVANVSKSFHDDYMRENARIREKLGLKPLIIRYGSGCCSWCSAVAGRYRFGEAPDDVFRRHDNCDCTIIYDTQVLRGERTEGGGRSKKWVEVDPAEVEARANEPVINSEERAREIEERGLRGLTKPGQGDILRVADNSAAIRLSINLFDKNTTIYLDALSIEEEPGFEDVHLHGSPSSVQVTRNGKPVNVSAQDFAEILKKSGYKGGDIRLCSCSTGYGDNSFAQQLSEILGCKVKAPDSDLFYIPNDGVLFVGSEFANTGSWRLFEKGVEIT